MEQNSISRLLRKVRTIQQLSLLAQCLMILAGADLGWRAAWLLTEHYSWHSPVPSLIPGGALVLWILARAIAKYRVTDDRANASIIDSLYGLKDRVSTYVELRKNGHPFLEPLIRESEAKMSHVSAWKASRFTSGMVGATVLLLFAASALMLIPYLPVPKAVIARKAERKAIAARAKELEETVHRLQQKPATPEMKKLQQEFKKVAQELQKPGIDRAQALKKLNTLEDQLRKLDAQNQQKLAKGLQDAWNEAKHGEAKDSSPDSEKAEIDQLAKAFDRAMEGKESAGGHREENLRMEQFSAKDIQSMKEALKKFEEQKAQADQMQSQLEEALKKAQQGSSGAPKKSLFMTDSRLTDREVETGKGGVEDGPGTTNKDTGPSHFDTRKKDAKSESIEDRTRAEYEQIYSGQRENAGKDPVYLQNQWNENGDPGYTRVRNFGLNKDPLLNGTADGTVKRNDQESAVRKERVPPSYQEIVRKYFENH
jgi:hypothetical protein